MKTNFINEVSNGCIFSVTFTKKDGTKRTLVGRRGVRSHLTGNGKPFFHKRVITVYDFTKAGYRMIPLDRIISYRANGKSVYYQRVF